MKINIFEMCNSLVADEQSRILYILAVLCVAMIVDFVTGTWAAKINTNIEYKSKEGINGILRKVASIFALVLCIPVAALIPQGLGIAALFVLYIGYLYFELTSIVENLDKLGVNVGPLKAFIQKVEDKGDGK